MLGGYIAVNSILIINCVVCFIGTFYILVLLDRIEAYKMHSSIQIISKDNHQKV